MIRKVKTHNSYIIFMTCFCTKSAKNEFYKCEKNSYNFLLCSLNNSSYIIHNIAAFYMFVVP